MPQSGINQIKARMEQTALIFAISPQMGPIKKFILSVITHYYNSPYKYYYP
jgi:hypothetical protein